MVKLVCYGVRETEVPFFEEINKKFGYDIKLVLSGLNDENVKEAMGAEAIMVRGGCKADRQNLELLKAARVPGYSPNAISELALSLAMMLLRHTAYTVNRTKDKNFTIDSFMFSKEIRNCTVVVLGAGRIGLTTAKLFKGLGARVIAYDVFQSDVAKEIVEFMELDQVLAEADIISVHMPYIQGVNERMINYEFIAKMKDNVILVNTSRGEVQDTEAIIRAIESGKLGGFGTDVLENEYDVFFKDLTGQALEDKTKEKLISLYPKVLVTPHIGSYTDEALTNMIEYSYENLREYLNDGTCKNSIA